jgi:lipopolysaccharide transport system ATP-binding protein
MLLKSNLCYKLDSNIAIKVENLSKLYTLRETTIGIDGQSTNELWALKEVSFEIKKGDSVGIIGPNGSGKSTLLKILAGITKPTAGKVTIKGKVASILDVGAGFHPELSGRENIFLNGQFLGFTKKEIQSHYEEIVEFSGIVKFIDQPVKNYSNGMYLRLAFSIMAHLDFDVYLFDEVFSVGDAEFGLRSKTKMQELSRKSKTMIFVSHNMSDLQNIDKFLLFEQGNLIEKSNDRKILTKYLENAFNFEEGKVCKSEMVLTEFSSIQTPKEIKVLEIRLFQEQHFDFFTTEKTLFLEVKYQKLLDIGTLDLVMNISDIQDQVIITSSPFIRGEVSENEKSGIYTLRCEIFGSLLNSQVYQLSLYFLKDLNKFTSQFQSSENLINLNVMGRNEVEIALGLPNIIAFKPTIQLSELRFDPNVIIKSEAGLLPDFKWKIAVNN